MVEEKKISEIDIEDIDLNEAYFHFTTKNNIESIQREGLKAQIGDASKMVGDKSRVCMSKGGKGVLGIKDSFILEFKELKICDIPQGYRKYFNITDYNNQDQVKETDVYDAMEKRFKDEIYYKVDAVEGEDYLEEDVFGLSAMYDIKGKENHDIKPEKLSIIKSKNGNTAYDILNYMYTRLLDNAKKIGEEENVRGTLTHLDQMFEYIKERDNHEISNENSFLKGLKEKVVPNTELKITEKNVSDKVIGEDNIIE